MGVGIFAHGDLGVWLRLFRVGLRSDRSYVAIASAAALGLVVHDMFDFALEMPGILAVFMVLLGALPPAARSSRRRHVRPKKLLGFNLLVGVVCQWLAWVWGLDVCPM